MIHQLAYVSASPEPDDPSDLPDILATAKRNNPRHGITGALSFSEGMYFQILEGERAAVRSLFDAIFVDPRHTSVTLLIERDVDRPMFPEWSMAWYRCPPGHPLSGQIRNVRRRGDLINTQMDDMLSALINAVHRSIHP